MRILVCGAGGMLGHDLARAAKEVGHEVTALSRAELDISDGGAVREAVLGAAPAAVINCAAYTDVDGAEAEAQPALKVNGEAAGVVAAVAAEVGASVLYPSSDYVFDGEKGSPYLESDETNPLSSYGRSKLAGERATAAANPRHFVVRSSWLFGTHGRNFVETMLSLGGELDEVVVVRDQLGSPTYTGHLAEGLVRLVDTRAYGLHHVASQGECSWYDFAREIFKQAEVDCRVLSTTTEEFARPAPRPAYSVLGTEFEEAIVLPPWQRGLESYLAERAVVR